MTLIYLLDAVSLFLGWLVFRYKFMPYIKGFARGFVKSFQNSNK